MRRLLVFMALAGLVAVIVIGLSQAGGGSEPTQPRAFDIADAQRRLAGAPSPLAGLHAQSAEILEGDPQSFARRLRSLRGHPVVINKWASWCGPCRSEFPVFQHVATERGKEVAFLGLNSGDKTPAALEFLEHFPVPYPSYEDPREDIASEYRAAKYFPMTIFIDEDGEVVYVHPGEYKSQADLEADIERYL